MYIPKEIAELLLTYSERYFKDSKAVELELEQYQQNDVNKIIENLNDELRGRPYTLKRTLIERRIKDVESGICNIGEYTKWLEETSETAKDILSKELEKTKDDTNKEEGNNLMRNIMHYKFLDYLSMFELGRLNILKDELEKLKEQTKSGTETIINTSEQIEVPEHLKELWSIWNNTDARTLISVYDSIKEFVKPTGENGNAKNGEKVRLYCLANELYKNNWLKFDGVATRIAEIFNKSFGFKPHTDDYTNYQYNVPKIKNTLNDKKELIKTLKIEPNR